MLNTNIKLHYYQKQLISKLSQGAGNKFNELILPGLESEHMNYHLKKLVAYGFVDKIDDKYQLSDIGKDYRNLMDDDVKIIEKQPKTSVIIKAVRPGTISDEVEYLLSKRLIQPYLGKVGRLGGKVKFGETLEEAVHRELYEETGLTANTVVLEQIYRKMRYRDDTDKGGEKEFVQDVIFYIYHCTDFEGTLIKKTEFQENFWITPSQSKSLDTFDNLSLPNSLKPSKLEINESIGLAQGY